MLEEGTANICSNIKVYIELIYEFSKVSRKINIQISVVFCALIMNFQKEKQENLVENFIKNNKIPQNKLNQGG